ncbi:glutamate-rich protein 3 [Polypterus senegalus]|uniref:glutamate-rich protein 3 n=1 Tax=Polypterus senegalus TaxID=55291 RepID=UPI001965768E|nr:glutamate-rich protein 3 [Polypterus senegalus]
MTLKQQQQAKKFALQDLLSKSVLERSPRYQLQKTASINIFALQEMSDDFYLPSISTSHSEVYLDDRYCHLSRSSPYLLGSACISEAPRRSSQHRSNQLPHLNKDQQKFLKRPKQSNVRLTMAYLGQGALAECRDELRVFQQICGGENLCVYKGYLSPGDQFHFVSRRHLGFPFSATLFINGIMATRISCCCEYRYNIGYQQGKRGCFRLMHLSGGKPCYRCAGFKSLKNTSGRRTFENGSLGCCESHPVVEDQRCEKDFNQDTSLPGTAKEVSSKAAEAQEQPDGNDSSYASSPLFIPRYKVNRQRPLLKYDQPDAASASSDSEASERENRWRPKRGRKCPRAAPQKGNEATQQKEQQLEYQDLKFSQKTSNGNQSGAPLHPDHKKHFRKKKRNRTETKKDVASETAAPQNGK